MSAIVDDKEVQAALEKLSPDDQRELVQALEMLSEHKLNNKILFFEPYEKQRLFMNMGGKKRERLFIAGNQVGKSEGGAYEDALHLLGDYPGWWDGKKFDRPTRGWCAGISSKDTRDILQKKLCGQPGVKSLLGTGFIPKDRLVDYSLARGVTDAFDTIQVTHKTKGIVDGISTLSFKSYEQGRESFQGDTIDFGHGDEEGPMDVYGEFLARLKGDGILYTTFTPLKGPTELVQHFCEPPLHPDRGFVTMTLWEAKHFTEEEKRKRYEGYAVHERQTRAEGIPKLGTGRVYTKITRDMIEEAALEYVPPSWAKIWGIDFGMNHPFAAVLLLHDRDNDIIHVHQAFRMGDALPMQHVIPMKQMGALVPVAWPHDGNKRTGALGETTAFIYKGQGLLTLPKHATHKDGSNGVEDGIKEIETYMAAGRFKVAGHLSDWFEEFSFYHREDGLIVKMRDDIMDATRYAFMMRRFAQVVNLGYADPKKQRRTSFRPDGIDFDPFDGE